MGGGEALFVTRSGRLAHENVGIVSRGLLSSFRYMPPNVTRSLVYMTLTLWGFFQRFVYAPPPTPPTAEIRKPRGPRAGVYLYITRVFGSRTPSKIITQSVKSYTRGIRKIKYRGKMIFVHENREESFIASGFVRL